MASMHQQQETLYIPSVCQKIKFDLKLVTDLDVHINPIILFSVHVNFVQIHQSEWFHYDWKKQKVSIANVYGGYMSCSFNHILEPEPSAL